MAKNRSAAGITNIVQYDANRNITFVSGSTTLLTVSSSGALTTSGTITATTLVVQTVTSSVNFITGSTRFGSISSNTHTFTGSLAVTGGINLNSGSLLVGTNSPIWTNGTTRGVVEINGPSQALLGFDVAGSGAGYLYHDGYNMTLNNGLNGYLSLRTNSAEVMRITGSNVGIGTSSPTRKFVVQDTSADPFISIKGAYPNQGGILFGDTTYTDASCAIRIDRENNALWFSTSGASSERMRINSDGRLFVGTSSIPSGFFGSKLNILADGDNGITIKLTTTSEASLAAWSAVSSGDNLFQLFYVDTARTQKGSIYYSRSSNQMRFDGYAAGTYSDARLKDIKGECSYGLDTISQIKVYDFNWLRNGKKGFGVKAQELYELIPEVVEVGDDSEINPQDFDYRNIWKVNYNELVPALVKAIQELKSQNDSLQQQINELKA